MWLVGGAFTEASGSSVLAVCSVNALQTSGAAASRLVRACTEKRFSMVARMEVWSNGVVDPERYTVPAWINGEIKTVGTRGPKRLKSNP